MMEGFHSGTRDLIRQTHPTTPPRSGQIPGFFQKFRQTTQTPAIRIQKPRIFNRLKIYESARREPLPFANDHNWIHPSADPGDGEISEQNGHNVPHYIP